MPYNKVTDLPDNVSQNLPKHAQEIYLAAYNNAFEEYKDPELREGDDSRETVAHKVAWAAVKTTYKKNEKTGKWEKI